MGMLSHEIGEKEHWRIKRSYIPKDLKECQRVGMGGLAGEVQQEMLSLD